MVEANAVFVMEMRRVLTAAPLVTAPANRSLGLAPDQRGGRRSSRDGGRVLAKRRPDRLRDLRRKYSPPNPPSQCGLVALVASVGVFFPGDRVDHYTARVGRPQSGSRVGSCQEPPAEKGTLVRSVARIGYPVVSIAGDIPHKNLQGKNYRIPKPAVHRIVQRGRETILKIKKA